MGQRANLIVVEKNEYTLYYDHWAANSLDSYLFWGPERAVAFFRDHEKSGVEYWLDTVWCEGGAVIDLDLKVLLFFGGEDIYYDILLRNTYLKLMRSMWPGYLIKWASNGVLDLARYVGYNDVQQLEEKISIDKDFRWDWYFKEENEKDLEGVLSVYDGKNQAIHSVYGYDAGEELLFAGPEIVEAIKCFSGHTTYLFPDLSTAEHPDFAKMGIHLDSVQKKVSFWLTKPLSVSMEQLQQLWSGWTVVNLLDDYKKHELLTGQQLTYLSCDEQKLVDRIRELVCIPYRDERKSTDTLIATLEETGKRLQVNPLVHATNLFDMPVALRKQLFDEIVNKMT